jgi:NADP-dependent aldehyde dehydrogenase
MLKGQQIISSRFVKKGINFFKAINPNSGNKLEPPFFEATDDEIDMAFKAAERAFWLYRKKIPSQRAEFLKRIGLELVSVKGDLIKRCHEETGLSETRLSAELTRTVGQLNLFAEVLKEGSWVDARIDTALPERQPVPKPDIRQIQIPLGPVGIFGASNFPLAFSVSGGDTASALAAGCPVVVKAHFAHPGTSELVGQAILRGQKRTSMPDGVFNLVQGRSEETGLAVVTHPMACAIGFTGSYRGGKALYDAAVRRDQPIPVYAEMGSVNPMFILPGVLAKEEDDLADKLVESVVLGVGQFCTNPGLVFIAQSKEGRLFEFFIKKVSTLLTNIPGGTMLTEGINYAYKSRVKKLSRVKGISVLAKGRAVDCGYEGVPYLFQTSVSEFLNNPQLEEEIFGPATLIVAGAGKEELMKAALQLDGHLTATIHGTSGDLEEYSDLIHLLENRVGRLIYNGFPTGVEVCPSMMHGGPFPATTDSRTTSVGTAAIRRFTRPVCYQNFPQKFLPDELKNENPMNIYRLVNGKWSTDKLLSKEE